MIGDSIVIAPTPDFLRAFQESLVFFLLGAFRCHRNTAIGLPDVIICQGSHKPNKYNKEEIQWQRKTSSILLKRVSFGLHCFETFRKRVLLTCGYLRLSTDPFTIFSEKRDGKGIKL